jgi:DNA-binding NarL/FixJ family response regulator
MTGRLIRLALQSRRRLIRDALRAYFDNLPEFDVVGQTAGLAALPELCALRRPDVAVAEVGRRWVRRRARRRPPGAAPAVRFTSTR